MHPWPTLEELPHYYPSTYWFSPVETTVSRLEEQYRRLVLGDHVRFVTGAVAPSAGSVLDVGCGGALFGRLLKERGYQTFGLDNSQQAAKVAWRQNGVPVVTGSFASSPFPPASFAVVTMFHVLEHLYDPGAYIEAAWHLLKPGGRLIVQVPNAASWQTLVFGEHWNGFDLPRHLINFRASDIQSLVSQKGFKVLRVKHFSLRDNPAGFASSLAPGLDPMARRVRAKDETPAGRLLRNLAYFGLVVGGVPFAVLEAACGAGASVMVDAQKAQ
jgi:2-polyprenyl-3-methyl-5-hydroxy-6-metoxy-1,4-benzoquinol methylase